MVAGETAQWIKVCVALTATSLQFPLLHQTSSHLQVMPAAWDLMRQDLHRDLCSHVHPLLPPPPRN